MNSEQYAWNDITIMMGGKVLFGCTGIEVEAGYEHEEIRAKGGKAQAINEKNFAVSGNLKLLQSDMESLTDSYGEEGYQKKYFDIVWAFAPKNGVPRTHIVKGAKLGRNKMSMSQGDAFMEIEVPYMALDFKRNQ